MGQLPEQVNVHGKAQARLLRHRLCLSGIQGLAVEAYPDGLYELTHTLRWAEIVKMQALPTIGLEQPAHTTAQQLAPMQIAQIADVGIGQQ